MTLNENVVISTDGTIFQLNPLPQTIIFYAGDKEALRITKDGITANPEVPVDEAAAAIFKALEPYIKALKP